MTEKCRTCGSEYGHREDCEYLRRLDAEASRDEWKRKADDHRRQRDEARRELKDRPARWKGIAEARERERDEARAQLRAVVEAIRIDHEQSIAPEEDAEGVKRWWKLPATKAALDDLDS